nr:hypothetical protein [Natronomonas aquatica]
MSVRSTVLLAFLVGALMRGAAVLTASATAATGTVELEHGLSQSPTEIEPNEPVTLSATVASAADRRRATRVRPARRNARAFAARPARRSGLIQRGIGRPSTVRRRSPARR